jgi:Na+-driven multidrug efflux pump
VLVTIFFFFAGDYVVSFFSVDDEVKKIAVQALRIISTGYIFYGIGMVMTNAFNGAGDTRTPTVINVLGFWVFQIPLAWVLAKSFAMGPTGVFLSIPIAETAISIASFILFRQGRWKNARV